MDVNVFYCFVLGFKVFMVLKVCLLFFLLIIIIFFWKVIVDVLFLGVGRLLVVGKVD